MNSHEGVGTHSLAKNPFDFGRTRCYTVGVEKATKATPNKRAYKGHLKQPFLAAYRKYGVIWRAARSVGVSRDAVHDWRKHDPEFAQQFDDALRSNTELLEDSAIRRALRGNTALLIFLLKARKPEKYSERYYYRVQSGKLANEISRAAGAVSSAVRRYVPDNCPACRVALGIRRRLAEEIDRLAAESVTT
jgi:hypothetical protein